MRKVVLTNDEIQKICKLIGNQLATRYRFNEHPPVFIGVMKGAIPFMMDLIKNVDIPLFIDFMQVSSYNGTESTGTVIIKKDLSLDIKDQDVVIIEDIVDSGISMNFLVDYLKRKYQPKSIVTVALLDKRIARKIPFELDYRGLEVEGGFLVGYGLDYNELFRNTTEIFIPDQEEIASWDLLLKK
jgi:hypoxanthine phosphoribosyltransferase